ncbi:toll-like receptor 4 [Saccoglossus kowalevskii]|uniref:Uncharacterized protein LOC102809950 n=1 Tax=Saccoglossus kowalevskii TaxID=10224 RepID=A0ABM0MKV3_SACKO|nr:PREDICTED: uncharacterized protein LOC102809950 [Saccoglossus kowalevskii]
MSSRMSSGSFEYDVNLIYHETHLDYALTYFMPVLEQRWRLRVCAKERDHLPGLPIANNIIQSAEESRVSVILFSKQFIEDGGWSTYESLVALQKMVTGSGRHRHAVIPVFVSSNVKDSNFRPFVHLNITDSMERQYFWKRMRDSLNICDRDVDLITVPPLVEDYYAAPGGPSTHGLHHHIVSHHRPSSLPLQESGEQNQEISSSTGAVQPNHQESLVDDIITWVTAGVFGIFVVKVLCWIITQLFGF